MLLLRVVKGHKLFPERIYLSEQLFLHSFPKDLKGKVLAYLFHNEICLLPRGLLMVIQCKFRNKKGTENCLQCKLTPEHILTANVQGIYKQLYPAFNLKEPMWKTTFWCLWFHWCRQISLTGFALTPVPSLGKPMATPIRRLWGLYSYYPWCKSVYWVTFLKKIIPGWLRNKIMNVCVMTIQFNSFIIISRSDKNNNKQNYRTMAVTKNKLNILYIVYD